MVEVVGAIQMGVQSLLCWFCPDCGLFLSDTDTHPDEGKRVLKCGLCGWCGPRPPQKAPEEPKMAP